MQKSDWGNAVWFLLHTLSHKLLPKHSAHAREVLPLMIRIATHLPCDECSRHARHMLLGMQSKPIRGRADLVEFWREAHNQVNQRTGKPYYPLKDCLEQYGKANTSLVVQHFKRVMGRIRAGDRGLGEGWRRDRVLSSFSQYMASHAYMYGR